MIFAGCGDNGGSDPEPSPSPAGIVMVPITGGTVNAAPTDNGGGIFSKCGGDVKMTVGSFKIAESETPYSVWYAVRVWAENNGYTFTNKGREGSGGTDGAAPTDGNSEPVTNISWRDAIVWCNAYSAAKNLTPVYYNADESAVLKDATACDASYNYYVDGAVVKADATGFRLPTEAQWEYAARGGKAGEATWNYIYAGTNNESLLSTYAVYNTDSTANVKTKAVNSANLYDMSGNVYEWCFDWYGDVPEVSEIDYIGAVSGLSRVVRSSSWNSSAGGCEVASRDRGHPYDRGNLLGFRVALPAD